MRQTMTRILLASACCWTATAEAQGAPDATGDSDRFSLGQIIVTAPPHQRDRD